MTITTTFYKTVAVLSALLMAVAGFSFAETASADRGERGHRDGVSVTNMNGAMVMNETAAHANTGGNYAGGSNGGDGGNGGDIENKGDRRQDVERSDTGNGGRGGDSAAGGLIQTGNANAAADVANLVNSNDTRIEGCGCEEDERRGRRGGSDSIRVFNGNGAFVWNGTHAGANTGFNAAEGSNAGEGGNGGDIENEEGGAQEVDQSTTGNGGVGGNSDIGGTVVSGAATARANVANIVNSNLTRVRR